MLTALYNIPNTPDEWNTWAYHHRLSHDAIRQAILTQKNIEVAEYILEPIYQDDLVGFLQRNEQAHSEMNAALGLQGVDLQDAELEDEKQKVAWIWLHALEHQTAEQALKI